MESTKILMMMVMMTKRFNEVQKFLIWHDHYISCINCSNVMISYME